METAKAAGRNAIIGITEQHEPVTILVVEPNFVEASRMSRALQCAGRMQAFVELITRPVPLWPERPPPVAPRRVISIGSLRELHECDLTDVAAVLSAVSLPDGNGIDVLAFVRGMRREVPVIIIGDRDEAQLMIESVRAGAIDFLVRNREYLNLLPLSVDKCLEHHRMRLENERLHSQLGQRNIQLQMAIGQLESLVRTDDLTGLANRRCFVDTLEREWAACLRNDRPLACIMIDLDGFKALNDACGHHRGDELLQLAARVISANCRDVDLPARLGGDEFTVLLPDATMETAVDVAERIREEFTQAMDLAVDVAGRLGMSIGVADNIVGQPGSAEALVRAADAALYVAKAAGKGRVCTSAA